MAKQSLFICLLLLLLSGCTSSHCSPSDSRGQVCVSQGGRFPKFSLEGRFPRASIKGPNDLTLCRIYRKKTCCMRAQTHPAFVSLRKLASNGEGSEDCLMFWEAMECSICDPQVGIKKGPPALCSSFCDRSLEACKDAFFSFDPIAQVLLPCGPKDIICARATQWADNGSHFCELAGFVVPGERDVVKPLCFDGRLGPADSDIAASRSHGKKGTFNNKGLLIDMLENLLDMDLGDVVTWAVGGLVLTAGAILMRRRSLSSQRRKAVLRSVHEARSKQEAVKQAGNRKIGKRVQHLK